MLIKLADK